MVGRARQAQEVGDGPGVLVRRVLDHEVARVRDDAQLRVGDLAGQAMGAGHGREGVVLAPEQQRRDPERGERAHVRLQLLEVSRAVELEHRGPALALHAAPVLVQGGPVDPRLTPRRSSSNASRVSPATSCSPSPGVRMARAIPCHLPSGKKPVSEMTSASTAPGGRRPSAGR
jgi:hypothetical protein